MSHLNNTFPIKSRAVSSRAYRLLAQMVPYGHQAWHWQNIGSKSLQVGAPCKDLSTWDSTSKQGIRAQ
ncbi:hypothetical protein P175DRAFT_0530263 [Aspergillus ochraceoroseus IBT 24754]|uniref:Uncharacterized protein n=1 Tax=Aspergillus ochraceoroseus IBT 24754 TaxID=1392256 RepID=A0A2T5M3P9_9EURO|nr:uncharacterized protein P175DRAFT_0530263 [Aspergillus ochraceoroseus IBT 24754]PTU23161.1 hypothetical protein P175DRAFT_0530263 [Aspergillus ochraceoroseus IBT 24754]